MTCVFASSATPACWRREISRPHARDALRRQLDILHKTADLDDPARQVEEDYRFHRLIFEIADNRRLLRLFDDLAAELRMVIGLIGRLYDDPHEIARTHEPLLAAIEAGHPERITAHVDHHIGHAWREVGRLVRELDAAEPAMPLHRRAEFYSNQRSNRVKAVYTELHRSHDPQFFLVRGVVQRTTEQPERADRLLAGLKAGKHDLVGADRVRSGPEVARPQRRISSLSGGGMGRLESRLVMQALK